MTNIKLSDLNKSQRKTIHQALRFATESWFNKGKVVKLELKPILDDVKYGVQLYFETNTFKPDTNRREFYRFRHVHQLFIGKKGGITAFKDSGRRVKGFSKSMLTYRMY